MVLWHRKWISESSRNRIKFSRLLTHFLTYLLTHSLAYSLTYSLNHLLTHSLISLKTASRTFISKLKKMCQFQEHFQNTLNYCTQSKSGIHLTTLVWVGHSGSRSTYKQAVKVNKIYAINFVIGKHSPPNRGEEWRDPFPRDGSFFQSRGPEDNVRPCCRFHSSAAFYWVGFDSRGGGKGVGLHSFTFGWIDLLFFIPAERTSASQQTEWSWFRKDFGLLLLTRKVTVCKGIMNYENICNDLLNIRNKHLSWIMKRIR